MIAYQTHSVKKYDSEEDVDEVRPAFLVTPALQDEDLSNPPMTGEQYLRRVIKEAKSLESTSIADSSKIPHRTNNKCPDYSLPDVKPCDKDLLPCKDWQLSSMADFSQLRLEVEKVREKLPHSKCLKINKSLPHRNLEKAWRKMICLTKGPDDLQKPSTEFCLALSQGKLCSLLNYFGDWINHGYISIKDSCRWVYCLLACLMLPAESDVYFYLRQIARALINSRSLLESKESEDLIHMNLLICIIGRYFNQTDLADPFVEEVKN